MLYSRAIKISLFWINSRDDGQVKVVSGCNAWHTHSHVEEHGGHDDVVHVAAMAGEEHQWYPTLAEGHSKTWIMTGEEYQWYPTLVEGHSKTWMMATILSYTKGLCTVDALITHWNVEIQMPKQGHEYHRNTLLSRVQFHCTCKGYIA